MLKRLLQQRGRRLPQYRVHRWCIDRNLVDKHRSWAFFSSSPTSTTPETAEQQPKESSAKRNDDDANRTPSVLQMILEQHRKIRQQQTLYERSAQTDPTHQQPEPPKEDPRKGATLFDVFPVTAKKQRKPNAFPDDLFRAYEAAALDVIGQSSFRYARRGAKKGGPKKKPISDKTAQLIAQWLTCDTPIVQVDLPSFTEAIQGRKQPELTYESNHIAMEEADRQRERFMEEMNFSESDYLCLTGAMFKMSNDLAKTGNGLAVSVLWEKMKEAGNTDKQMLHNMLYVAATFPTGGMGSKARRKRSKYGHLAGLVSILDSLDSIDTQGKEDDGVEESSVDIVDEIAIYHDLFYPPTEQSINIRMKQLVSQGKAQEADALLRGHLDDVSLHLRVFRPVLRLYFELGDSASALRLFKRMMELSSVILDPETYMYVLHGLAKNGNLRPDAPPLEGIEGTGFPAAGGPELFDEVAKIMSDEIIEIPDNMAKFFRSALAESFPNCISDDSSPLAPLPLANTRNPHASVLAERVIIPEDSGCCPLTGAKLRLVEISKDDQLALVEKLLAHAKSSQKQHLQRVNTRNFDLKNAIEHLNNFKKWLDERSGDPFTTFVDGANVGYYHQNYEGGRFSFHQIKFVVDALMRQGENPLVILPYKYSKPTFLVSDKATGTTKAHRQHLSETERRIQQDLGERNCVYYVPFSLHDDIYWILASVSSQTNSRQGRDLTVPHDRRDGRWPGKRPVLVTNDQMRDHQVELLAPMLFRRWYSNCIVNYTFYPFSGEDQRSKSIGFSPADFFSREIQANDDESGDTVWHFPLKDTDNQWFCVKLQRKKSH